MPHWGKSQPHRRAVSPPSLPRRSSSTATSRSPVQFFPLRCSGQAVADDVPRRQPSLRAHARTPAQDGVWARSWRVLPYSRRLVPQKAMRSPKRFNALSPTPSPEGPRRPLFSPCGQCDVWRLGDGLQPIVLTSRPHLVQYHSQLAGQCDLGLAEPAALGHSDGPGFQGAPAPAVVDQHVGCLI